MSKATRPVWGLFLLLLAMAAVTIVVRATRPKEIIPWRTDLAAAREEAGRTGKPVMAYFTASWCGPCQSLRHTTWADKTVDAALRDYVPVKVDVDADAAAAQRYEVRSIPAFAVLDAEGKAKKSTDGAMAPEQFVAWLKGVGSNAE